MRLWRVEGAEEDLPVLLVAAADQDKAAGSRIDSIVGSTAGRLGTDLPADFHQQQMREGEEQQRWVEGQALEEGGFEGVGADAVEEGEAGWQEGDLEA